MPQAAASAIGQGRACDSHGPITAQRCLFKAQPALGPGVGAGVRRPCGRLCLWGAGWGRGAGETDSPAAPAPPGPPSLPRLPGQRLRVASRAGARKSEVALRPRRMRGSSNPRSERGPCAPRPRAAWPRAGLGLPSPQEPQVNAGLCYTEHLPEGAPIGSVQPGGCVFTVVQPSHPNLPHSFHHPEKKHCTPPRFLSTPRRPGPPAQAPSHPLRVPWMRLYCTC